MAPILIGSLAAGAFAAGLAGAAFAGSLAGVGAGLAWAITIETEMILKIKTKTVRIANFLILLLLSSFLYCPSERGEESLLSP
jgi:TRAP-type mannitol/chloroaromatic compound transport system permease large subunit